MEPSEAVRQVFFQTLVSHFCSSCVTLSDWPPLENTGPHWKTPENTGNNGSHKMLKIRGIAANLGIKKPALSGNAGHFIHKVQVEPADFEPLSQSPNLLDSTGTAKHRPCVCPCLQLPVNAMSKDLCWPCPSQYRTLIQGRI